MKRASSTSNVGFIHCNQREDSSSMVNDDNDTEEKDDTKRKSRNLSEKKRRDQFNMLINELCSMVSTTNRKMDKSSVLRATIAFLRSHSEVSVQSQTFEVQENWKPSFLCNEEFTHLMLEALDAFIIVFSCTGRILYTSESITSLLGFLPGDHPLTSIFDIVHESDRPSIYKLLNNASTEATAGHDSEDSSHSILVHMKHGPIHYQGSLPTYKLVRLVGTFHQWASSSIDGLCNFEYDSNSCSSTCSPISSATNMEWKLCFVAIARIQTPQLLREMTVSDGSKNEFTSRHSLEWKFLFLDHRAPPIIGYLPFEVLGTSGYDYYHVDDLEQISACHEALMQTGEGTSCYYRFLTKGQQWIWLQTRYYITYHQWNSKPEFIVCSHSVVSYEQVQSSYKKEKSNRKCEDTAKMETSSRANPMLPPTPSARQSPTPSLSSRGSVSSAHSDRSSVATSSIQVAPVLYDNHCEDEEVVPSGIERLASKKLSNSGSFVQSETPPSQLPSVSQEQIGNNHNVPVIGSTLLQPQSALPQQSGTSVVTVATIQPLMGLSGSPVLASSTLPELQQPVNQTDRSQPTFIMTPSQSQLQDYLWRRHQLLQQQILLQQEELRRVSEQLMLVQFVAPSLAVTTGPYQATSTVSTFSGSNVHNMQTLHSPLVQPQLNTSHTGETVISKTVLAPSMAKHASPSTATLLNSEVSVQFLPPPQPVMPMQLSQEQAQVVFTKRYSPSNQSLLQNT